MIPTLDERIGRALAIWVGSVRAHAKSVALAFLVATIALGTYAALFLGLNTDEMDLFSDDLPSFHLRADLYRAFPALSDPVVVVVDGATADLARDAAEALVERVGRSEAFETVYQPFGGDFFETHGLLYLDGEELEDLADHLYEVQPFLARLSRDTSLRGLFALLSDAVEAAADGTFEDPALPSVIERIAAVVDAAARGENAALSWGEVLMDREDTTQDRRRYLLVDAVVDYEQLQPAGAALEELRSIVTDLGFDDPQRVEVRATGVFPLAYEEMEHLNEQMTWAGVASFVLVSLVLGLGLGSWRLVLASVVTLIVGLVFTAAFAAAAVGHVNLISVAFAILFIGLSIDFAIHLCIRYRELLTGGDSAEAALCGAARSVGTSLVLCAATTAIGFYAFLPTEFAGVGELGLIAGTGMFISLFTNLTLLPALITLMVPEGGVRPLPTLPSAARAVIGFPTKNARLVVGSTVVLVVAALFALPAIRFDSNPLRMRDPSTASVEVFDEMLAAGDALPWNFHVLADDREGAAALAEKLEALPEVDFTVTLDDFVPEGQGAKLEILEELSFILLPTLGPEAALPPPTGAERAAALAELEASLAALPQNLEPSLARAVAQLGEALADLRQHLASGAESPEALLRLESALIGSLPERLRILRRALEPGPIELENLPESLVAQMRGTDGRIRIEVFPAEDLNDQAALEAYVRAVQTVSPRAFGEAAVIVETSDAVARSMLQALATAGVAIAILLLALWRSVGDAALVATPLALAALFTAASTVLLDMSFNFANVIVIPLLLGMGVDTGIHLIHRARSMPGDDLLQTTTAAAVLLSALTTISSFGTLGFSAHRGMASLGQLLALGMALILAANLVVLPALIRVVRGRRGRPGSAAG